jgi:HK97 family phage portal protein
MAWWWNRRKTPDTETKALSAVPGGGRGSGWFSILESYGGAWQNNVEIKRDSVLSFHAVFACQSLIASDISKLPLMLMVRDSDGVWVERTNPAYTPVLRRPNNYQTIKQFLESWIISKLQYGNTYVLKVRDARNVVVQMHVLDPKLVTVLVADNGDVFYQLSNDRLSGLTEGSITVPATEIIHDRFNCLFHPLVGISPIFAAGLAATQGLAIQTDSTKFFENGARPGGILSAPGAISDETAARLKAHWDENYSGSKAGKVAVLGDNLKYEALKSKATDAQMIESLKWSAEIVCGVYHVPPFMIGVGAEPTYDNVQTVTLRYYSQCLQVLIVDIVMLLDDGLGLDGVKIGVEFDTDELLRMDALTQMDVLEKSKGKLTVNEQRKRLNRGPVTGGDTVYLQEQDHSLEWLAKRDAQPFEPPEADPVTPPADNDNELAAQADKAMIAILKGLR